MRPCIEQGGYTVDIEPDGSYTVGAGLGSDHWDAIRELTARCQARYPFDPRFLEPLTEAEARTVYGHLTSVILPCLRSEGLTPADAPTFEVFFEQLGGANAYAAQSALSSLSEDEYLRVFGLCEVRGIPSRELRPDVG